MKERPILFSTDMVRAILLGHKTQTRRVFKDLQKLNGYDFVHVLSGDSGRDLTVKQPLDAAYAGVRHKNADPMGSPLYLKCRYGQPGDRLYVRETWCQDSRGGKMENGEDAVYYRADLPGNTWEGFWKPSIHMPKWASRITLEIIKVRVERLNDISGDDAEAEGIERVGGTYSCSPWKNYRIGKKGEMNLHCSARERSYMTLWESINGPGSWNVIPWVWVIEFKMVKPIV